jgi:hypothetical protein
MSRTGFEARFKESCPKLHGQFGECTADFCADADLDPTGYGADEAYTARPARPSPSAGALLLVQRAPAQPRTTWTNRMTDKAP